MNVADAKKTYQWTKVAGQYGEHRVFLDGVTGRYSICDDGGETPEFTDDGCLWLVPGGKAVVQLDQFRGISVRYNVDCHGVTDGGATSRLHVLPYLKKVGYEIEIDKELKRDLKLLLGVFLKLEDCGSVQSLTGTTFARNVGQ